MRVVHFTVPGEPHGKARARTVRGKDGKVHSYTPESTKIYEGLVRMNYIKTALFRFSPMEELAVTITAFFPVPKSTSKKKAKEMLSGKVRPTKKPDIDNVAKAVLDALNGLAYNDDSQVVTLRAEKHYSTDPRVEVKIQSLGEVL